MGGRLRLDGFHGFPRFSPCRDSCLGHEQFPVFSFHSFSKLDPTFRFPVFRIVELL